MLNDLAFAARTLRKNLAFSLTAVTTIALGIGASTAIFSVVEAVLIRPLPYADAQHLMLIEADLKTRKLINFPFPPGDYPDVRQQATAFGDIGAVVTGRGGWTDGNAPEQVITAGVTDNFFRVLGIHIPLGRDFEPDDATAPPPPPAGTPVNPAAGPPAMTLLSYEFWMRRYGGDASVIGRTIESGGAKFQIIGVLPRGTELLFPHDAGIDAQPDLYSALRIDYSTASRLNVFMRLVGRLKPSASIAAAQQHLDLAAADLRERFPIKKSAGLVIRIVPMDSGLVADVRTGLLALMGAVMLVLLIACANVSNLLLVRASMRHRELAVRSALGGTRGRLVQQMLAESLVIAVAGGLLGLAIAAAGIQFLLTMESAATLPRSNAVAIDPLVFGFATAVALVAAMVFGILPALRASRPQLAQALRGGGRTANLEGGGRLRDAVVMVEVALSFVLLIGCGLMVRSFTKIVRSDPGFDPDGLLTFSIGNPNARSRDDREAFNNVVRTRLRGLPGVTGVTAAGPFPLDGTPGNVRWGTPEAEADPSRFQQADLHVVLPGYFDVMRTRLLAGRAFTPADDDSASTAVLIDDVLAKKAFPGESAVGKRLFVRARSNNPEWFVVVGVVAHERNAPLVADTREAMFFTDGQFGFGAATRWAVRTAGDPTRLSPSVRAAVTQIDPQLVIAEVQPAQALLDRSAAATRFALVLITIFAVIAAALASVGLYGVLSTVVRQRTAEIGVRMAFGATAASIFRLVIGRGLQLGGIGIALGILVAIGVTRVMANMLVGVTPTDPTTFAGVVVLFLAVATLACWVPAQRAASLDPNAALREE
jgi:putative ABC transport system permease protein